MTIAWAVLGVALFTGLVGGVHCMGMCGGIVSALTGGTKASGGSWSLPLFYNLGRIASYGIAGAIAGAFGSLGL
ncbi:MAG: sulfite exporter TauE/SafE family protein, partial [Betaproteobacteria bacterium]|nr:sulfite exporter TauE/SafE family protein [Betaproteobacteria bacterium]